jgi:hypothetical protein
MKRLLVKLGFLGVLSSAYLAGLNATAVTPSPKLIPKCCITGSAECCGPHACYAGGDHCIAN